MKRCDPSLLTALLLMLFCVNGGSTWGQSAEAFGHWKVVEAADHSEPVARHEAAFVRVADKFYLLGGRGMKPVNIYDPQTQHWQTGATPPIEIHHFQPIVWQDKIYVLGALTGKFPGETPIEHIYIYHPQEDKWEKGPAIPPTRNRGSTGVVRYQDKIYLLCGIKDGHRGDHKKWTDVYDLKNQSWQTLADAPRARDHFQAIEADGKIYVLGGRRTSTSGTPFGNTETAVDVYDIASDSWTTLAEDLPTARAGNYAIQVDNEILVLGGESTAHEHAHAEVEALDLETFTWHTYAPMIQGRHGTGVVKYQNTIYVASGSGNRGGGPELTTMESLGF